MNVGSPYCTLDVLYVRHCAVDAVKNNLDAKMTTKRSVLNSLAVDLSALGDFLAEAGQRGLLLIESSAGQVLYLFIYLFLSFFLSFFLYCFSLPTQYIIPLPLSDHDLPSRQGSGRSIETTSFSSNNTSRAITVPRPMLAIRLLEKCPMLYCPLSPPDRLRHITVQYGAQYRTQYVLSTLVRDQPNL